MDIVYGPLDLNRSWNNLHIDDSTKTDDPNSMQNGTITMSGDYMQIPLQANAIRQDLNDGLLLHFPIPDDLMTENNFLLVRVTFESLPAKEWTTMVGIWEDTQNDGITIGLRSRHATTPNTATTYAADGTTASQGTYKTVSSDITCYGYITYGGTLDGTNNCRFGTIGRMPNNDEDGNSMVAQTSGLIANANSDNMALIVSCAHPINSNDSETISVRCSYQVIPWPPLN